MLLPARIAAVSQALSTFITTLPIADNGTVKQRNETKPRLFVAVLARIAAVSTQALSTLITTPPVADNGTVKRRNETTDKRNEPRSQLPLWYIRL